MTWLLDGKPLRSVLVTRLRYLGDVVMSTVVLETLRRGDPELDLAYLCERAAGPLLAAHPLLCALHLLDSRRGGTDAVARQAYGEHVSHAAAGFWRTVRDLRRRRYDLSVDLFFNPRSAWLLRFAGAPLRIGGPRGSRRRLYTHLSVAPTPAEDRDFRTAAPGGLGEHLGRLLPLRHAETGLSFRDWFLREYPSGLMPRLVLPAAAPGPAADALAALGLAQGDDYTLLLPGATWPTKAWAASNWGTLARSLEDAGRGPVVMLPPPSGGEAYTQDVEGAGLRDGGCLPPLPLGEALRVVAGSRLVVAVDGGLMHAAVALGRPTVALFGPTDPAIWFPYESFGPYRVLCARTPCHPCDLHHCDDFICMHALMPRDVLAAADTLETPMGGPS